MAAKSIRVVVLEGSFAGLSAVGFPISLSLQLQQNGLKLSEALWTAKSTDSGFSVSFFWSRANSLQHDAEKRKKNRRKRKNKARKVPVGVHEQPDDKISVATVTNHAESPFNAHQDSPELSSVAVSQPGSQDKQADDSDSGSNTQDCTTPKHDEVQPVDLKLCSNVKYDKKDGVHGVSYCLEDGDNGWTPVRSKRVKRAVPLHLVRRRAPPHVKATLPSSSDSESASDSESSSTSLTIPDHAEVNYSIVDGKPGLLVSTRNTRSWTPIAARTRAKLKS